MQWKEEERPSLENLDVLVTCIDMAKMALEQGECNVTDVTNW